jgi:hypothetical protein
MQQGARRSSYMERLGGLICIGRAQLTILILNPGPSS